MAKAKKRSAAIRIRYLSGNGVVHESVIESRFGKYASFLISNGAHVNTQRITCEESEPDPEKDDVVPSVAGTFCLVASSPEPVVEPVALSETETPEA